jgi:hypothetical protein
MLGYLYGKRFGSKIACANRKEGDRRVRTCPYPVTLHTYPPMKMEQCSEASEYKIQMPGNYPEESIQNMQFFFILFLARVRRRRPFGTSSRRNSVNCRHFVVSTNCSRFVAPAPKHTCRHSQHGHRTKMKGVSDAHRFAFAEQEACRRNGTWPALY